MFVTMAVMTTWHPVPLTSHVKIFSRGQLKGKDLVINHERINNKNIDSLGFFESP